MHPCKVEIVHQITLKLEYNFLEWKLRITFFYGLKMNTEISARTNSEIRTATALVSQTAERKATCHIDKQAGRQYRQAMQLRQYIN